RYSAEGFSVLGDLIGELGMDVIFTGSMEERRLIEEIQFQMMSRSFNFGGELSLKEFIALLSEAPLLVSNNSGPVHIAAGLGLPTVVLYALTNPQHTPWMIPNRVLYKNVPCGFCYKSICPK